MNTSFFPLRLLLYMIITTSALHLTGLAVIRYGAESVAFEGGILERIHLTLAITIAVGLLSSTLLFRAVRQIHFLLFVLASMAVVRELDFMPFYRALNAGVWHWIGLILFGSALLLTLVLGDLKECLLEWFARPSSTLFLLGFAVTAGWAQVMGQKEFWTALDASIRGPRRFTEEALEVVGYLTILFGVVEEYIFLFRSRREADKSGDQIAA